MAPCFRMKQVGVHTLIQISHSLPEGAPLEAMEGTAVSPDFRMALQAAVEEAGALGWDGYHVVRKRRNVPDSGVLSRLYLECSDGTTVTVYGYDASPEGFSELLQRAMELFYQYS